jgi:GxxExxY protein
VGEKEELDRITDTIIGAAIEVHRALGPGLLESAYEACLGFELKARGLGVMMQKPLPVVYKAVHLDCAYRIDLLVEGQVVVEVKAVDQLAPIHQAQLLSYLQLSRLKVGLLINFHANPLKNGIRRVVRDYPDPLRSLRPSAPSAVKRTRP